MQGDNVVKAMMESGDFIRTKKKILYSRYYFGEIEDVEDRVLTVLQKYDDYYLCVIKPRVMVEINKKDIKEEYDIIHINETSPIERGVMIV